MILKFVALPTAWYRYGDVAVRVRRGARWWPAVRIGRETLIVIVDAVTFEDGEG